MSIDQAEPDADAARAAAVGAGDEELPSESKRQSRLRWTALRGHEGLGRRSLTARLVAGVTVVVIVLVAAIGTATYYSLRSYLDGQFDQQLQTTARGIDYLFRGSSENGPRSQDIWGVALDPSTGAVVTYPSGQGIVALRLSTAERAAIATRQTTKPLTVTTSDGHEIRITTRPGTVRFGDGSFVNATIAVGLSTSLEDDTLARLVRLEILVGTAAVVLALIATSFGVRRSLRNLYRVTSTAQDVATELSPSGAGLERRVPVTEHGTEVGQLAESFNTMLAAVETQFAARVASEERMRQFMADASHELRTPLTSIRGYAELARMQREVGEPAEDNIARIESEGTRMSRLVEDLLLLARGEGEGDNRPQRQELIDVTGLVDDAVRSSRAAIPDREITMYVTDDPHVVGDPDQLLRVVRNLVTNAAIHTAPERPIQVLAGTTPEGVVIQVIDGGPGLPPEEAAHVFERFWRADKARTRARGGSGLGLSIVASIVAAHAGTVRFDSTVEGGSTVTVILPDAQRELD